MADDARDDVFDLEVPVSNGPEDLDDVEQQETRADDFDGDDRLTLGTAHRADEHGPEVLPEGGRADDASLLTVAAEGNLTQLDDVSRSTTAQDAVLPGGDAPDADAGHGIDRDIGGRPGGAFGHSDNSGPRAVFDTEGNGPDGGVSQDTTGAATAEPGAVAAGVAETAAPTQDEVGSGNSRNEDVSADESVEADVALAADPEDSGSSGESDATGSDNEEAAEGGSTNLQGDSGQSEDGQSGQAQDTSGPVADSDSGGANDIAGVDSSDDGNNGHGNDVGGYDDSNPGNSQGTSAQGNNKDKDDNGHGNDEGGYDDSNPGKSKGTAPQSQPAQSGDEAEDDEDNEAGQTLDGTKNDDTLSGGSGDDVIDGGKGDDTISGGLGDDVMSGGIGHDRFTISNNDFDGNAWTDQISGDQGTDTIDLSAVDQGWTLTVNGSDDPIVSSETGLSEYTEGGAFSGVVDFDDGSSVVFDGVERVEW